MHNVSTANDANSFILLNFNDCILLQQRYYKLCLVYQFDLLVLLTTNVSVLVSGLWNLHKSLLV